MRVATSFNPLFFVEFERRGGKMRQTTTAKTLLFGIACGWIFSVSAQTPTPKPKPKTDDEVIKVDSRLVMVPVSVTDAEGRPVMGLTAADFRLSEENRPQTIENIRSADLVPLEIALLFDV